MDHLGPLDMPRLNIGLTTVRSQTRFPEGVDFSDPPQGYTTLSAGMGFYIPMSEGSLGVTLTIENLLDEGYREYLDRFRYFADQPGRNTSIRLNYLF